MAVTVAQQRSEAYPYMEALILGGLTLILQVQCMLSCMSIFQWTGNGFKKIAS